MKKKPLIIVLLGWIYIVGLPLFYYLQVAYFEKIPFYNFFQVVKETYWVYLWLPLSSIIVGIGILNVKIWGWYLFIIHGLSIIAWNIFILISFSGYPKWLLLAFCIITLGVIGIFLRRHIRSPYFNPKIRWWNQEKRFGIFLPTIVKEDSTQNCYSGKTFDISASGLFFAGDLDTQIGRKVEIKINSKEFDPPILIGEVVWVGKASEKRPAGCGIRYLNMNFQTRRLLRKELKKIESIRSS